MADFTLKSFDDMFKSTEVENKAEEKTEKEIVVEEKIVHKTPMVKTNKLMKFADHPFKEYEGDKLQDLADSIKEHGILVPILVRPIEDDEFEYQIVAGHNRVNACKLLGIEEIPVNIRAMDDDTATIYMVETNFKQRQNMFPSEKAFAYKIQLDALKRQGKRLDLGEDNTSCQVGTKLQAGELVAKSNEVSKRQVHRYIRLTHLIPDLLNMVDNEKIAFMSAVNVSYLSEEQQKHLCDVLDNERVKLSLKHAETLKTLAPTNKLDYAEILDILEETKKKSQKKTTVKLSKANKINLNLKPVQHYFNCDEITETDLNNIILKALSNYFENVQNIEQSEELDPSEEM